MRIIAEKNNIYLSEKYLSQIDLIVLLFFTNRNCSKNYYAKWRERKKTPFLLSNHWLERRDIYFQRVNQPSVLDAARLTFSLTLSLSTFKCTCSIISMLNSPSQFVSDTECDFNNKMKANEIKRERERKKQNVNNNQQPFGYRGSQSVWP